MPLRKSTQRKKKRVNSRRRIKRKNIYKGGNKKKLGIIISGRITSYEHSISYINSIFNNPKYECKMFCSLNIESTNPYIDKFCNIFGVTAEQLNIERINIPQSFVDMNKEKCKDTPVGDSPPPTQFDGCYSIYSMFYNQNKAFKLLEKYKEKHSYNFDIVLVFRADINPSNKENPPVFPIYDYIFPNTVYIPRISNTDTKIDAKKDSSNCYTNGISTISAYGDFNTMKKYCSLIENITSLDHVEIMLLNHLNNMNLKISRFIHEITNNPERKKIKIDGTPVDATEPGKLNILNHLNSIKKIDKSM
jgi:hypothetical protein